MGPSRERAKVDESFPYRLRAARIKAGLSLEDLAQKLGGMVSRQALAKYEKGLISPSPRVLSHLLQVLEIPPSIEAYNYAFGPSRKEIFLKKESLSYPEGEKTQEFLKAEKSAPLAEKSSWLFMKIPSDRAKKLISEASFKLSSLRGPEQEMTVRPEPRLSSKQLLALKTKLAEMMAKYLWLEKLLRMEIIFESPFKGKVNICLQKAADVEKAAEKLRDHWNLGIGVVVNLLAFLEDQGIKIFKIEGPEEFESLCGFYSGHPFIALRGDMPVDRIRFKTSYELAHLLFGLAESPEQLKLYSHFAGAFLLPAKKLEEYFLPVGRKIALSELIEIKLRYGVSIQATMHRALDLGLVTERRFRSFRELMAEKGWLRHEPVDYRGEESPVRFRRLLHYAVSSGILDLKTAAFLAEMKPEELKKEMGEIF